MNATSSPPISSYGPGIGSILGTKESAADLKHVADHAEAPCAGRLLGFRSNGGQILILRAVAGFSKGPSHGPSATAARCDRTPNCRGSVVGFWSLTGNDQDHFQEVMWFHARRIAMGTSTGSQPFAYVRLIKRPDWPLQTDSFIFRLKANRPTVTAAQWDELDLSGFLLKSDETPNQWEEAPDSTQSSRTPASTARERGKKTDSRPPRRVRHSSAGSLHGGVGLDWKAAGRPVPKSNVRRRDFGRRSIATPGNRVPIEPESPTRWPSPRDTTVSQQPTRLSLDREIVDLERRGYPVSIRESDSTSTELTVLGELGGAVVLCCDDFPQTAPNVFMVRDGIEVAAEIDWETSSSLLSALEPLLGDPQAPPESGNRNKHDVGGDDGPDASSVRGGFSPKKPGNTSGVQNNAEAVLRFFTTAPDDQIIPCFFPWM